jgi:Uma2 family endonuclease
LRHGAAVIGGRGAKSGGRGGRAVALDPPRVDLSLKLAGYFRLASLAHYLIVDPTARRIVHHARGQNETIIIRIVTEGAISLDPPGLELRMADIYDEA